MKQPKLPTLMEKPIKHGSLYAYTFRDCRCELCVEAFRTYHREYGKTKRRERGLKPRGGIKRVTTEVRDVTGPSVVHSLDPWTNPQRQNHPRG